jgi:hypothetical protein
MTNEIWDYKLEGIVRSEMDRRGIELVLLAALKELEEKGFLLEGRSWIRVAQSTEPIKDPVVADDIIKWKAQYDFYKFGNASII